MIVDVNLGPTHPQGDILMTKTKATAKLSGQWIGRYTGTNSGLAVLELDDQETHFEGQLYAWDDDSTKPNAAMPILTPNGKPRKFEIPVRVNPIDPQRWVIATWPQVASFYPGVTFPQTGTLKFLCKADSIGVRWGTNATSSGTAVLARAQATRPSDLKPLPIKTWDEFKKFATSLEHYKYMYRGQENSKWRLRTYFHRTGRADLLRFLVVDLPELHQHATPFLKHKLNRNDPVENAAFLALIQHHGYPTPMLDWTYSPFIAAYFAFNDLKQSDIKEGKSVRIFIFNKMLWEADLSQIGRFTPANLHFSILAPAPFNNDRLLPQQALTSITNVDDIESYIHSRGNDEHKYLQVVDLPVTEREQVTAELKLMGITAGALFPGLDGVCKQVRERFFW